MSSALQAGVTKVTYGLASAHRIGSYQTVYASKTLNSFPLKLAYRNIQIPSVRSLSPRLEHVDPDCRPISLTRTSNPCMCHGSLYFSFGTMTPDRRLARLASFGTNIWLTAAPLARSQVSFILLAERCFLTCRLKRHPLIPQHFQALRCCQLRRVTVFPGEVKEVLKSKTGSLFQQGRNRAALDFSLRSSYCILCFST